MLPDHLIIDFDSTFITKESLDELARLVLLNHKDGVERLKDVEALTLYGMEGKISFSESLEKRLKHIESDQEDVQNTLKILENQITDSFKENEEFLKNYSEQIFIVSSGFHELIDPIVTRYGINKNNIFANNFLYEKNKIIGFNKNNPLSKSHGKVEIVKSLNLKGKVFVIGDGYTDYEIKRDGYADTFFLFIVYL